MSSTTLLTSTTPLTPGTKPPVSVTSPESANTASISTTALGPSKLTSTAPTVSSAGSTHTPYSQPPPDPYHLNAANYIVVPVIIIVSILVGGTWYLIHRRKMIQKQKRIERMESLMAEKARSRQQRRDKMREQANTDDAAKRNTTEGLDWGLAANEP
ncbi:hypothetical protein N431DRAFT_472625 [Stipitochalara longipes BDJ]|nr:hypothetical protein N431DRAFT_472625 [Stipitochalara longipes BDJ]